MRVYQLFSEKYAKENLKNQRLKISLFADLNDPFELLSVELKKNIRTTFQRWKESINKKYGVLCFSRSWKSPVLWSHYADKHKGICLGFDIPNEFLKEVKYKGELLAIDVEKEIEDKKPIGEIRDMLLRTKFKHWEYEEEERVILPLDKTYKEGDLYFINFCESLKIKEIIVGARCKIKKAELEKLLGTNPKDVKLIKARLAFTRFEVVNNKQGFK